MESFPEVVTFRITSNCSNNCRYCYGPKNIPALRFSKLKKIFQLFRQRGVKAVVLTGGEPLLHPEISDILPELKKHKFRVFLDTNGDFFFAHKNSINRYVDVLGLPLDVAMPFKSYRSPQNFSNILKILTYYQNARARPKIRVGTVVTRENIGELEAIAQLLKDYPIDRWKIYQFIPIGPVASQNKQELTVATPAFLKQAGRIIKDYSRYLKIIVSPRQKRANAYFLINPDGTVLMPTDSKRGCREIIIGNIFDEDIIPKWQKLVLENNYLGNAGRTFAHRWQNYPMKPIYNRIWRLAKYYCQKGQFYTADHIDWHIGEALTLAKGEKIDEDLFIPFIILHDVGYIRTAEESPFAPRTRKIHMRAGKKIAQEILAKVHYSEDKIKVISRYIGIHDSWALGENSIYRQDQFLGLFNDLDFVSMFSPEGFPAMARCLKKNSVELLSYLENNEKHTLRPFVTATTQRLYQNYLQYKKKEVLAV